MKRRNGIFERAKFNSRKQLQDETVDDFITDLFCLAEHSSYGELRDEMIRDRLVVGLLDASLSEKMQLDPELTLSKALAMAHLTEAIRQQQPVVRGMLQQDCPSVEHEKIETLRYNPKNANRPRWGGTISDRTLSITRIPYSLPNIRFIGVPRLHWG